MSAAKAKAKFETNSESFYDDSAYKTVPAEEFEPGPTELSLESFTKDEICTKCGTWRTEHDYDHCRKPNFSSLG